MVTSSYKTRTGIIQFMNVKADGKFSQRCSSQGGTRWRRWLRHCDTSWKVEVSIPDGIIGIWHNPTDRTMALGLTQSLTEMSTRNIFWVVKAAGA